MISAFILGYGYLAVFAGTLLEGETLLLAAGFASHQGLLDWRFVVLVGFVGSTLGDQLAYLLGRWKGAAVIERFPGLARRAGQVHDLLNRHHVAFILANRFLYGLRIAGPLVVGANGIPLGRFVPLNLMGAAIWAMTVTAAGYYFGAAMGALLPDLKSAEEIVLVAILAVGLLTLKFRFGHVNHKQRRSPR